MRPLFRPEVIEAQGQQALGRVQLVQPPAMGWLSLGAVAVVAALLVAAWTVPHVRRLHADGVLLDPSRAEVSVPAAAVASLHAGQPARLHFEALPPRAGGHAGARVAQVARTPRADGQYAVLLSLDTDAPKPLPALEAGMRVDAVVELQRGRLADALIERR